MNSEFQQVPNGTQIAFARGSMDVQRRYYPRVNFTEAIKIRERFNISNDAKFADLIVRLNNAANRYHLAGSMVSPKDSAVANWIKNKLTLKAVSTIADAKAKNPELFKEVADYAGSELDANNRATIEAARKVAEDAEFLKQSKIPVDEHVPDSLLESSMHNALEAADLESIYQLREVHGFDVQKVGDFFSLGGARYVEQWFDMAPKILLALHATHSKLLDRNYGHDKLSEAVKAMEAENGLPTHSIDALTRENIFYGRDLPKLYERITGNNFEGVRQDAEVSYQPCYRFVRRAARIVRLSSLANITIQDHFDKVKAAKSLP